MNASMAGGMFSKLLDPNTSQPTQAPAPTLPAANAEPKSDPSPPPKPLPTPGVLPKKRKQVSAYLSPTQVQILKQLYFKLNAGDENIEKSEIIGLGLEVLSWWLDSQVLKYTSTQQLRAYLRTQMAPYLGSQVPDNLAT